MAGRARAILDLDEHMVDISPAMNALYHGDRARAEELLPDEPDIFEAAAFGMIERLRALIAAHAEAVSLKAADDFTPLHLAAFFGRADAVRVLLDSGADVAAEATNSFVERVQPLHSAAANRDPQCCRLLLDAGANVNAQQGDGFTPLMEAAQAGDVELTRMFLSAGASAEIGRGDGRTAVDLARDGSHQLVLALLDAARSSA